MRTLAGIALGLVLACSVEGPTEVAEFAPLPVSDQAGTLEDGLVCDDGETAFVERVIIAMWGRRSLSARETALLEALSLEVGRKGLVVAIHIAEAVQHGLCKQDAGSRLLKRHRIRQGIAKERFPEVAQNLGL